MPKTYEFATPGGLVVELRDPSVRLLARLNRMDDKVDQCEALIDGIVVSVDDGDTDDIGIADAIAIMEHVLERVELLTEHGADDPLASA